MKNTIFTCFFFMSLSIFAQNTETIVVADKNDLLLVGKQTYFLEDKSGKMTIEDVLKPENQARFERNKKDIFQAQNPISHYWLKITVKNQTQEPMWFEIGAVTPRYIDYYCLDSANYVLKAQTGVFRSSELKPFPTNTYWFPLNPNFQEQSIYLKLYFETSLPVPLLVGSLPSLVRHKDLHDYMVGGFIGLVFIMLGYNFFLYFATKDGVYRWYLGYLIALLCIVPATHNYLFIADWFPDSFRTYWYSYLFLWYAPFFFFVGFFSIRFLNIKTQNPYIYRYILGIILITCVLVPILNLSQLTTVQLISSIYQSFLLLFYLSLFAISLYLRFILKNKNSFYYLLAWSGFMLSMVILVLSLQGLIPYNYLTRNAILFGASWEILMFSLALANRITTMRKEKELSEVALLEKTKENEKLLKEQNEILEQKVNAKTLDLQVAYEEIRTANLELAHTQTETIFQKEILEIKNTQLEEQKYKINQSIESAKLIQHAILPTPQKMDSIFTEHFVLFMPKDTVSGDFYTVNQTENKKLLIVADCTGHGVSGAFMTLIGSALLDRIVNMSIIHDPKMILEKLHFEIQMVLQQKETGNKDGMDVMVLLLEENTNLAGSENPQGFKITFSGAKRPLYYVIEGEEKVRKIAGSRKMIGGFESNKKEFVNEYLDLPKNSLLYLCTDGYADQNNEERRKFGEHKLLEMLNEMQNLALESQKDLLHAEILQFMGNEEQRDDILIVGVRL